MQEIKGWVELKVKIKGERLIELLANSEYMSKQGFIVLVKREYLKSKDEYSVEYFPTVAFTRFRVIDPGYALYAEEIMFSQEISGFTYRANMGSDNAVLRKRIQKDMANLAKEIQRKSK